jgi:hypothetical protein
MFRLFDNLKLFFRIRRTWTGGLVFRLHYQVTVCIILTSCAVLAARQYVGEPIHCIHSNDLPQNVINAFCWVHSTFSMESAFTKRVDVDISHPGVDNSQSGQGATREHRYYQWVAFCLVLQVSDSRIAEWYCQWVTFCLVLQVSE